MPEPLKFFVSGQPVSLNHAYGRRRNGTLYLTRAAKAWKQAVGWRLYGEMPNRARPWQHPKIVYRFTGTRCDADNLVKICQDAIKDVLHCDDRYFSIAHASASREGEPGVWIEIEEAA